MTKQKWTSEQKQLFGYLTDYVTDNATAGIIVNGGELGYTYGRGGYIPYTDDEAATDEFYQEQTQFGAYWFSLDGCTYLVGSRV